MFFVQAFNGKCDKPRLWKLRVLEMTLSTSPARAAQKVCLVICAALFERLETS